MKTFWITFRPTLDKFKTVAFLIVCLVLLWIFFGWTRGLISAGFVTFPLEIMDLWGLKAEPLSFLGFSIPNPLDYLPQIKFALTFDLILLYVLVCVYGFTDRYFLSQK